MKIVALAGGVGGAKLAHGLAYLPYIEKLSVIVNTGDDFEHYGLSICPDLDTVCYTLADLANPMTGWGRKNETWEVLEQLKNLGSSTWFQLGDKDIATHLERTRLLAQGMTLSQITRLFCETWKIKAQVLPMSNEPVRTIVTTLSDEKLSFQEYFVKYNCSPLVKSFCFSGVELAKPAPEVMNVIQQADFVVICPSNPWVSIDPILSLHGITELLKEKQVCAISPIIQGKTIKGPAAKMFSELGITPSALAVAKHYCEKGILNSFVSDLLDRDEEDEIKRCGIISLQTNTIMKSVEDRINLADEIIKFLEII